MDRRGQRFSQFTLPFNEDCSLLMPLFQTRTLCLLAGFLFLQLAHANDGYSDPSAPSTAAAARGNPSPASNNVPDIPLLYGIAYELNSFRPLYRESYFFDSGSAAASRRSRVVYASLQPDVAVTDPSGSAGQVFSIKDIDYTSSPVAPDYRIADFRQMQLQGAVGSVGDSMSKRLSLYKLSPASGTLFFEKDDFERLPSLLSGPLAKDIDSLEAAKQASVPVTELVTDAGFDKFIVSNWKSLVSEGRRLKFEFAVPSRAQAVGMSISRISQQDCQRKVLADLPDTLGENIPLPVCFKLEARSWIIGQVLKPIYLVYDNRQTLQIFRGLSNIRGPSNEKLRVAIRYYYDGQSVP